ISVSLYKPYPLAEFEYELKYVQGPFGDISTVAYENVEKGVWVFSNQGLVRSIIYRPTQKEREQFSYPCKSPDAGDDVELPPYWFDRYWNLPSKKEKQRLKQITDKESRRAEGKQIYLVYYYKNEKDKESGLTQANRAKTYLELAGISLDKIKVVNGGKENKSEIVVYLVDPK
ncbi:MAG: hypothetical protein LC778_09485, partial [Acidobacteria bacterium]|nr:hypothetical protein [Acidobacteriota bacterium]